jgi:hypothetical protein
MKPLKTKGNQMINPNKTHRVRNAIVTAVNATHLNWCEFRSKGTSFGGWIDKAKFKVGDRVNLQVKFSITMGRYIVKTARLPRNSKKIKITETFAVVTEESASIGDFAETGWNDKKGILFDTPEEAAEYLKNEGALERSSSEFHAGIWYSSDPEQDIHDGSYTTRSFHLDDSEENQRLIYSILFPKKERAA